MTDNHTQNIQPAGSLPQDAIQAALASIFEPVAEIQLLRAKKVLTTAEAAKLYGVGKSTLDQMRMRGEGPEYYQQGKGAPVLYTHEAMEKWLKKGLVHTSS